MRGLDWCGLVSGWELHGLHFLGVGPLRGVCAGGIASVRGVIHCGLRIMWWSPCGCVGLVGGSLSLY